MQNLLLMAAMLLPGLKSSPLCPRPLLINIDLNHKIDRLVFKRTFYKCRRQYKKSPCLVKLHQPQKGAFQATCGETQLGLKDGLRVGANAPETEAEEAIFEPNCSSEIFENYLSEDWSTFAMAPIVPRVNVRFCQSLNTGS